MEGIGRDRRRRSRSGGIFPRALKRTIGEGRRVAVATAPSPAGIILLTPVALAAAKLVGAAHGRRARDPSEAALFAQAKQVARGGDPAAYRALVAWRDAAGPPRRTSPRFPSVQAVERRPMDKIELVMESIANGASSDRHVEAPRHRPRSMERG